MVDGVRVYLIIVKDLNGFLAVPYVDGLDRIPLAKHDSVLIELQQAIARLFQSIFDYGSLRLPIVPKSQFLHFSSRHK